MNPEKQLVIIDGNDRTDSIAFVQAFEPNRYQIRFYNSKTDYDYSANRVQILNQQRMIDPASVIVYINGTVRRNIEKIVDYGKYYRFYCDGIWSSSYLRNEVELVQNCLNKATARSLFEYFKEIASKVGIVTEDGNNILRRQYELIDGVSAETVLNNYFNQKEPEARSAAKNLIFPFGLNQSQKTAVENAFSSQISIIQGPPGTGKTQTILNIIANAVFNKQSVAVVSNNNSATLNVAEKLSKNGISFISAFLGNLNNKIQFLQNQPAYPNMESWSMPHKDMLVLSEKIRERRNDLNTMLNARNRLAAIEREILLLEPEKGHFEEYYSSCPNIEIPPRQIQKLNSKKLSALWLELESAYEYPSRSFIKQIPFLFRFGKNSLSLLKSDPKGSIPFIQRAFYEKKLVELRDEKDCLEKKLRDFCLDEQVNDLKQLSMRLLKAELANRYANNGKRRIYGMGDFTNRPKEFIADYPIVLSTTYSIKGTLSADYVYDYLIIDEASQVDLATAVLAFSCAKNVVIVGDLKQLPNVLPEQTRQITDAVWARYSFVEPFCFSRHSLLSSSAEIWKDAPSVMLREHYRCHPKIAEFINRKFYNGDLIVMTKDSGETDALCMYRTAKGNHARGHVNQRQIDVIREEVLPKLQKAGHSDIGIITPYRDQVFAIQQQLGDNYEVATVHKFQGREKEAVIITSVDNKIGDFVDDPNLLNVAVSRAISSLTVIMSANKDNENTGFGDLAKYIAYNTLAVIDSQVYSVFDLLYENYTAQRKAYLSRHHRISEYDSENLAFSIIDSVLKQEKFRSVKCVIHSSLATLVKNYSLLTNEESRYAGNPLTHIDFLLFNTMDKAPILAIEIDGTAFHAPGSVQAKRDNMKNAILEKLQLPLLRIKTNESGERTRIEAALIAAMNSSDPA